jgi:VIT1/CCC1 family predicted Fe2+/Mn2+ transporter
MRISFPKKSIAQQLRSFVFGVEDSLVSTVGLLSGIAAGGVPRATIFLTGVVLIFVEAFSMGVGNYLSNLSEREYLTHRGMRKNDGSLIPSSLLMFFGYFIAGGIPLTPYLFLSVYYALPLSVCLSLASLFLLGLWTGTFTHVHPFRTALRMFVFGGSAICIGLIVGWVVK